MLQALLTNKPDVKNKFVTFFVLLLQTGKEILSGYVMNERNEFKRVLKRWPEHWIPLPSISVQNALDPQNMANSKSLPLRI